MSRVIHNGGNEIANKHFIFKELKIQMPTAEPLSQ